VANRAGCRGTRRDGQPCTAPTVSASGYCWAHDPSRVAERHAARQRGGYNSAHLARVHKLMPRQLTTVYDRLDRALVGVEAGRLDPRAASAMAALARAMVSVLQAGELEERVRELEGSRRA
jgi:hypothetical protein